MTSTGVRRAGRIAGVAIALLAVGGLVGWSLATVFTPDRHGTDSEPFALAEVAPGEVGSSIRVNTTARWDRVPAGTNRAAGTVTQVMVSSGAEVAQGDALYAVDLRPVVIARGEVPAFRALSRGAVGEDVAQLQQLLSDLGYYSGAADGSFGSLTSQAVRRWQKAQGVTADGVVRDGDLVFVPALPARVFLDPELIARGARVDGSEDALSVASASPTFELSLTEGQASLIPEGTLVEITAPGGETWSARTAAVSTGEDEQQVVRLSPVADVPICETACGDVTIDGEMLLPSVVFTVESVAGLVVPTAALTIGAGQDVVVVDEDGVAHGVTVVASANGMAVVEGVRNGLRVRLSPDGT